MVDRLPALIRVLRLFLPLSVMASASVAAQVAAPSYDQAPDGFIAVKGERALAMGYPAGLEIWTYPLQLASEYRVRFRVPGRVEPLDAAPLLRRVERTPVETIRTYVGPDFVVRERLFVPRQRAGAIVRYEVEGRPDVRIEASFRPSLNLMWPGALGGQSIAWDAARSGYVEREPLHGFRATIASTEAVAHDEVTNQARDAPDRIALLLAPKPAPEGNRAATLVFALDGKPTDDAAAIRTGEAAARVDAYAHARQVLDTSLAIETPDPAVNRALASATLALDQALACNDLLGCGEVAGYGPSRPGRRPQYAWFFAGDGLVAMQAMLDAGQFERARAELEFIARYQDKKSGMIWHEMSQSAGLIDWSKYPYMYVHVDITFQYLAGVADYLRATGDTAFVRGHWAGIAQAWRYCRSVIDARTGLPTIPAGKQGQNEQEKLRDDIQLSSLWVDAAKGYAMLARAVGHAADARFADAAAARARIAIAANDWDDAKGFWLTGHRADGTAFANQRSDAIGVLDQDVFAAGRVDRALDRLGSPDFVTDWGLRSLSASDPAYDPNPYSSGSVWALGTATAARVFYRQHRPLTGWALWRGLAEWDMLDSAGHIHELLAGDLYHPELESVPEQTWSSAGLLSSAVRGLLGLSVNAADRAITFAPHLPAEWDDVTLRNVRIGSERLTLAVHRDAGGVALTVDNPGAPVSISFDPSIPLSAAAAAPAIARDDGQDRHALIHVTAPTGRTERRINYTGGIAVQPLTTLPEIGDGSRNFIVARTALDGDVLSIGGWATAAASAAIVLRSPWSLAIGSGGSLDRTAPDTYRLTVDRPAAAGYQPVAATVRIVGR